MKTEIIQLNPDRNVSLTVYLHEDERRRPAVIVLPGGYYHFCSYGESDPAAFAYLNAGYQAFILRYTVGDDMVWPQPLDDYEMAMELIREKAEEWHIYPDKIAVCGFSSGGHLASAAATMSQNRPNAAILAYAVLGECVTLRNATAPNTTNAVDEHTPPCFLFQSRIDPNVPVKYPIEFMEALARHNVIFESHIYAYGPHGKCTLSTAPLAGDDKYCSRMRNWVEDSVSWMKDLFGEFTDTCMAEPRLK